MPSTTKDQAGGLGNNYNYAGNSPTSAPYEIRETSKQSRTDTLWLDTDSLRSASAAHSRRASPTPSFQGHYLSNTAPTAPAIPISLPGVVSGRTDIRGFCASQWKKHRAPIYVFSAQFFGALMNLFARLLEVSEDETKIHPMQLLFWRQLITTIICTIYIIKTQIPNGVLGHRDVRWLLVARGVSGFFGIYGVWYSIQYLPLSEATVITFIAPNLAGYWCHLFLKEPFTRTEQLASFLALGGVVLITKPTSLFSDATQGEGAVQATMETVLNNATAMATQGLDATGSTVVDSFEPTTSQRLGAIGVALLGVVGTSFAFTTIRAVGTRAHAFLSVNYFSGLCVIVTLSVLALAPLLDIGQPDLRIEFPSSIRQWGFLLLMTACGFILQVLITKGLALERSNRATAMTYTQMIFAAGFDRIFWGTTIGWVSGTGCAMITAGAIWVAASKKGTPKGKLDETDVDVERAATVRAQGIEGVPMLGGELDDQDEDDIVLGNMR
ncbi:hypothetical protein F4777DRAFT_63745 [Nemania sp. FL0916]|nr:hypothetical protein F4777DRAFT_63745 [Nemania sp. FL0916]